MLPNSSQKHRTGPRVSDLPTRARDNDRALCCYSASGDMLPVIQKCLGWFYPLTQSRVLNVSAVEEFQWPSLGNAGLFAWPRRG